MKIEEILFWIMFGLGIIVFFWSLLGNSPTLEQALLIFILGIVIKNSSKINNINTKIEVIKEKTGNVEQRFDSLVSDFKQHIKHK